jgi:5-deoxy-D-glucuronate isomerase
MRTAEVLTLPLRAFDFSNAGSGATQTMRLTRATPVEDLRKVVVVARVKAVKITGSATLRLVAVAAAPTDEQPEVEYTASDELASLDVHSASAGQRLEAAILPPLPTHLQLRLVAGQAATPQTISATLGVSLEGWD